MIQGMENKFEECFIGTPLLKNIKAVILYFFFEIKVYDVEKEDIMDCRENETRAEIKEETLRRIIGFVA